MQINLFSKKRSIAIREMKEKKKKKWKIFVKFFLFLTFIYKILYFRHRSDLLPVIKKDEVYRYKTSTRIIARATKR